MSPKMIGGLVAVVGSILALLPAAPASAVQTAGVKRGCTHDTWMGEACIVVNGRASTAHYIHAELEIDDPFLKGRCDIKVRLRATNPNGTSYVSTKLSSCAGNGNPSFTSFAWTAGKNYQARSSICIEFGAINPWVGFFVWSDDLACIWLPL